MKPAAAMRGVYDRMDPLITRWMARHGIRLIRISLGIVFFWFGILKFFPGLSPAEQLAGRTIEKLSGGLILPATSLPILTAWETLIGLGLLTGKAMLEGQYIIKNLVLISAALIIGSTVRGGHISSEPD